MVLSSGVFSPLIFRHVILAFSRRQNSKGRQIKDTSLVFFPSLNLSLSHLCWCAMQKFSATINWNVSWANPCNIIPARSPVETTLAVNRGGRYLVTTHTLYSSVRKKKGLLLVLLRHLLLPLLHLLLLQEKGCLCRHTWDGATTAGTSALVIVPLRLQFFPLFMETLRPNQESDRSEPELSPRVCDRMLSIDKKRCSWDGNKLLAERRVGHDLLAGVGALFS